MAASASPIAFCPSTGAHPQTDRTTVTVAISSTVHDLANRLPLRNRMGSRKRKGAPAGLEAFKGLVTTQFLKQPGDTAWATDQEVKEYKEFLKKYAPSVNADDYSVLVAYMNVHAVELVLKKCGDELTRENLIRQATSLHGERLPMMLPGISISTKPDDYGAFKTLRIAVFDGESWSLTGDPMSAE